MLEMSKAISKNFGLRRSHWTSQFSKQKRWNQVLIQDFWSDTILGISPDFSWNKRWLFFARDVIFDETLFHNGNELFLPKDLFYRSLISWLLHQFRI